MSDQPLPHSDLILYQTEDGRTRVQCRFENETVWMTQALMAELFQKDVRTINEHLQNIFAEQELFPAATIRKFRIVRSEGSRQVVREIEYYNLEAIISVGYRVKSHRGTQFSEHLGNIFASGEQKEDSVIRKFRTTAADGKACRVDYHNLEVIQ